MQPWRFFCLSPPTCVFIHTDRLCSHGNSSVSLRDTIGFITSHGNSSVSLRDTIGFITMTIFSPCRSCNKIKRGRARREQIYHEWNLDMAFRRRLRNGFHERTLRELVITKENIASFSVVYYFLKLSASSLFTHKGRRAFFL
ncbi:hypothetical protein KP509_32G058500 [Ceratopteris richardii]|uniref:Uncharacterized protein n=1 Tax=Ceratopteris richardii TaxID=49495 RepID=A0A8T2QUB4_CERRI|nr:hypothetical protein KP509_32G058500 [Ceratopteris richardii]